MAHDALGHPQPFFAPISAAISLSTSGIRRGRRIAQMVLGVALGIGVSELAVGLVGTGPVQIGAVVLVTMAVALVLAIGFVGEGMMFVNQSVASAILVIALRAHGTGSERLLDACVGGGVAAVVAVGLFPADPLALLRAAEREVLRSFAGALGRTAKLLASATVPDAGWTLAAAADIYRRLGALAAARVTARATARVAPRRWRLRGTVAAEDARIRHIDLLANAVLSLLRAAVGALEEGEAVPPSLCRAVEGLAIALGRLAATPAPWPAAVLEEVAGQTRSALEAVAPQIAPRVPILAALVRATGRDVLRLLPPGDGAGALSSGAAGGRAVAAARPDRASG